MGAARTAEMPVLTARRVPGRLDSDPAMWTGRCPLCRRNHRHVAEIGAIEMVLPARCDPARFYRVQEAELPVAGEGGERGCR
jgi:hypothetical protein